MTMVSSCVAVLLTMGNQRKFPDAQQLLCLRGIVDVRLPKFLADVHC